MAAGPRPGAGPLGDSPDVRLTGTAYGRAFRGPHVCTIAFLELCHRSVDVRHTRPPPVPTSIAARWRQGRGCTRLGGPDEHSPSRHRAAHGGPAPSATGRASRRVELDCCSGRADDAGSGTCERRPAVNDADKVHVVVGASGGTGSALVRELLGRGRTVRAVNRSGRLTAPAGVEVVSGDATDTERMRDVCRGAGVVYNAVNVPFVQWRQCFPAAIDGVLAGARAADARMVFVDDTWMYGRVSGPMTEDIPSRPVSNKGVLRAWLAERVLAAHASGQVRTVIGRAPELYGPAVESVLGHGLFGPALGRGRRAMWVGAMDEPLGPMFVDDFAHGLAELGEHEGALGRAWHVPTPTPTTARAFLDTIAAQAGRPLKVLRLGERSMRTMGLAWPVAREGAEMLYQFQQPHSVDATAYRTAFGDGQVTPYEVGIERTLAWYRSTPSRPLVAIGR